MIKKDNFKFWCPIEKAQNPIYDPTTGEEIMRLGGIASTFDEDSDGEFLDPNGFDINPLINSGMVNWHHQAKGQPATIIGEPSKAEVRKDGLYIETDLYPSSSIARDVWELAQTLEKDSKTRRLGYSIEGRVVKRKSNDKKSPDYNIVEKAIITGVAITHQPKNHKTFANIIKGEIGDINDEEEEDEETEEKSLDTETAAPLKKESLDKNIKSQVFSKSEVIEKLLKDIPAINIEKATKIHSMLVKFVNMKKRKDVTNDDIQKAYEALGLDVDLNDVEKGCGTSSAAPVKKSEDEDDDDEKVEKASEEDEEDVDEDDEKEEKPKIEKSEGGNRFDRLEKAITMSHNINSKYIKALGVMIKDASQKLDAAASREEELMDIIKGQDETISALTEKIETFGSFVPAPKSISSARTVERNFAKGNDNDFGNNEKTTNEKVISMSKQKGVVAEILDQATFSKGYDEEFSKAVTSFEANKNLPSNIIARIKNEFGIQIVK